MTRKYVAFDLETAKEVPGADFNWRPHRPLGIACAAILPCDAASPTIWHGRTSDGAPARQMSRDDCRNLVDHLTRMAADGYTVLTWNGLGFDFDVLAEEAGALDACRELALQHVDMMFHIFCDRGFPVALDKAAQAQQIPGKPAGMSGILAPQLWAQGRFQEVLDYVGHDVRIALAVAEKCEQKKSFAWLTRKGTVSTMKLGRGWLPVAEARRLPEPDTSWMNAPMSRQEFLQWTISR